MARKGGRLAGADAAVSLPIVFCTGEERVIGFFRA